jgi:hypothetical protein
MPWQRVGGKAYYYRSRRIGGRPVRLYVGTGPAGEAAATSDARERLRREAQARAWRRQEACRAEALAPLLQLGWLTDLLTRAALLAAGYHEHHRTWRLRRAPERDAESGGDAGGR